MTDAVNNAIEKIKEKLKNVVLKTSLRTPLDSYRFLFILVVLNLWNIFRSRKRIGNLKRYKKAINNSQSNIVFLFNCFLSSNYNRLFPHLLAENPEKYLKYVSVEGKEYVRQLMEKDTGVILISGHFGPDFRTLLFKDIFGIVVSIFARKAFRKKIGSSSFKLYKINDASPNYSVGEEKQFQEGLLRKEWIIFLNDVPVEKRESNNQTLFGKNIYLSELPFKLSIKYNIPILFVGTTRVKRQYLVSILPIDEFKTQAEGLGKYIALIEKLLCRDPYAGIFIADHHFREY